MHLPNPLQEKLDHLAPGDDWGVQAADALLAEGTRLGLSDIHLVSLRGHLEVRGRREDELFLLARIPRAVQDLLISRLKVLARIPAFVRQEPQDGRLEWRPGPDRGIMILRAAFLPTMHGEAVTIRMPEGNAQEMTLRDLGMSGAVRSALLRLLNRREGVIFTTGPSGSGKTTTLYALLRHLNQERGDRLSFFTIEDPVEAELPFAAQVQVNAAQNVTFDRALRAALRQSPSVLLIGEVRDPETARIAVQAGMTGHLVLSTLHAGRAAKVPIRLLSLKVEPYLVTAALAGCLAQRLVRLRKTKRDGPLRTGVFELLPINEELRELLLQQAPIGQFSEAARDVQIEDLVETGRRLHQEGLLTREELELTIGDEQR